MFTIQEKEIIARLGAPRKDVQRARRELQQGMDWELVGKHVCWSIDGAVRLASRLGIACTFGAPSVPEGAQAVPAAPAAELMTVHRWRFPNPRIIQCRRQDGSLVFVRVRNSKNFRPTLTTGKPMEIRAFRDLTAWALVGNCPRWPGKW